MNGFPGRSGRRRRVLNQESASAPSAAGRRGEERDCTAAPAPRYSEAAGSEHHPQVSDFVPRRYRTLVVLGCCGVLTAAGCWLLDARSWGLDTWHSSASIQHLGTNLATWASSVLLLAAGSACLLIHSLRRHRIDDIRGRYRVWRWAAAACLFASITSVAALHVVVADVLSQWTGWTMLRGGAIWWLVVVGLPLAWIAARAAWDAWECRLAASLALLAGVGYAVAVTSSLGLLSIGELHHAPSIPIIAGLLGHWTLLLAVVAYARFVVLDAQGLIPGSGAQRQESSTEEGLDSGSATSDSSPPSATTQWVDGSNPESEDNDGADDEHGGVRKLTKAERKRLRKHKAQRRAA